MNTSKHAKLTPPRIVHRQRVVNREEEILRLSRGKCVLHLGCVDYPFTKLRGEQLLHRQLLKVTSDLYGVDASREGVEQLLAEGFSHLMVADVEQMGPGTIPEKCDLIIAGEIIEHLACPGAFLRSLKAQMHHDTQLLLTTPNAFGFKGFVHSLLGREKVHPDHNYYFSHFTISQLLTKFGFQCEETCYYQEVRGDGIARIIEHSVSVITRLWPTFADGLFVRASLRQ